MGKLNEHGHSVSLENCNNLAYPGFLDFKQKNGHMFLQDSYWEYSLLHSRF